MRKLSREQVHVRLLEASSNQYFWIRKNCSQHMHYNSTTFGVISWGGRWVRAMPLPNAAIRRASALPAQMKQNSSWTSVCYNQKLQLIKSMDIEGSTRDLFYHDLFSSSVLKIDREIYMTPKLDYHPVGINKQNKWRQRFHGTTAHKTFCVWTLLKFKSLL